MRKNSHYKKDPAYRTVDSNLVNKLIALDIGADRRYDFTLGTYMSDNNLEKIPEKLDIEIQSKIATLHEAGFVHCDLHEFNIVFDIIDNGRCSYVEYAVRLIEFETLRAISELKDSDEETKMICKFLGMDHYGYDCTLEGLMKFEKEYNYRQCEKF